VRRIVLTFAALAVAACGHGSRGANAPSTTTLTPAQIAERALPSVVLIKVPGGLGTGFIVWGDGRIVTNFHVLLMPIETGTSKGFDATVVLADGREFQHPEVLAADPDHDLAILKIPGHELPALTLADSSKIKPGESVVAIGHPLGLGDTVSNGLVSAVREIDPQHTLLQISAPIAPGSSGGPLFNEHGEVIGVATYYSTEGQNLNFGVPANRIKPLLLEEKGVPIERLPQLLLTRWLGCTPEEAAATSNAISHAIELGVPLFNGGDKEGCAKVYTDTAQMIIDNVRGCPRIKDRLHLAIDNASKQQEWGAKAWEMRHAFDEILKLFAIAIGR